MSAPALHLKPMSRCPDCDSRLHIRTRRADGGQFVGCSAYPKCRFTADAGDQVLRSQLFRAYEEIEDLRPRARFVETRQESNGPLQPPAVIRSKLRDLISFTHPDRHPGGLVDATEVTARLNQLRQEVAA